MGAERWKGLGECGVVRQERCSAAGVGLDRVGSVRQDWKVVARRDLDRHLPASHGSKG